MRRWLILAILLVLCVFRGNALSEMEYKRLDPPAGFTIMRSNPEDGGLILYSAIPNLKFDSNMNGIVKVQEKLEEQKYILFLKTMTSQVIIVKAINYVELHIPVRNLQAQEVRYFSISPKLKPEDIGKGNFSISSKPEGARIVIDGNPTFNEKTPFSIKGYRSGDYLITLKKDSYLDTTFFFQIKENESTSKSVSLTPDRVDFEVNSHPSGLPLYLNAQLLGNTPIILKGIKNGIKAGEYQLEIRSDTPFLADFKEKINLRAGSIYQKEFILDDLSAWLSLSPQTQPCKVYLNQTENTTLSNGEKEKLKEGVYTVKVIKDNPDADFYDAWIQKVDLKKGQHLRLNPVFDSLFAHIRIMSSLKPLEVYIDGKKHFQLSETHSARLKAGKHHVRIEYAGSRKDAYSSFTTEIILQENENEIIQADIKAKEGLISISNKQTEARYFIKDLQSDENFKAYEQNGSNTLLTGDYLIRAESKGFLPETKKVSIKQDEISYLAFKPKSYKGSLQECTDFWNLQKKTAGYSALSAFAFTGFAYLMSENAYNNYEKSLNSKDALQYRNEYHDWQNYALIGLSSATVMTIYRYFSNQKYKEKNERLNKLSE